MKDLFPRATLILQVVDYYPAFRGDYIKSIEKRDYERADHIFLIGRSLVDYVARELGVPADKVTVLGQGVALDRYQGAPPEPNDIETIPRPRAIWVGAMEKGDGELFEAAAEELGRRRGSLILIGPEADWAKQLARRRDNIHLLGSRPAREIPSYLLQSDLGIMLYDRSRGRTRRGEKHDHRAATEE